MNKDLIFSKKEVLLFSMNDGFSKFTGEFHKTNLDFNIENNILCKMYQEGI